METKLSIRKISEMREVTMSSEALAKEGDGPAVEEAYSRQRTSLRAQRAAYSRQRTSLRAQRAAYYMIRKPGMNITVLPEYRLGKEYPKTYGHFHQPESEETYGILLGEAAVLIQRGIDPVEEISLVKLKKGDSITIPKGYAHSLINLGRGPVVTVDDNDPARMTNDYEPIRKKRGFAYYIVEEDGKIKAVPNPNYAQVSRLEIEG